MASRLGPLISCAFLLGCATGSAIGSTSVPPAPAARAPSSKWPPLPSDIVKGRAATPDDVRAGRAVFAAQKDGVVLGEPLPLPLPQYA